MAEKVSDKLETIINEKAKDNKMLVAIIKAKLMLKGIYPDRLTSRSFEDPLLIAKIKEVISQI